MRLTSILILSLMTSACALGKGGEPIELIEMRLSGWSSIDIVIDDQGQGHYEISEPFPDGKHGTFTIGQVKLAEILSHLEPYREQSVPFSDQSAVEFIRHTCPQGVPSRSDAGAFYVRWVTSGTDSHYLADFGCDHQRYAARNTDILNLVESLPIPRQ